jgi:plasmid stabilization system protein ParE
MGRRHWLLAGRDVHNAAGEIRELSDEIWTHIAEDNIDAADRFEDRFHQAMEMLGRMPGLGHRRSDVRRDDY